MEYSFDDWKKALTDFQNSVTKDLEEIRQYKEEVRQLKSEIFDAMNNGYYLHDEHRIVISAPEIIIGNVDRDGILRTGMDSNVVIRAHQVQLEGVGEGGQVQTKASRIRQTAVNPGIDGQEAVVESLSEIVSQARSVVLEADGDMEVFARDPASAGEGSVRIHADGNLELESAVSVETLKTIIENKLKVLDDRKKASEKEVKAGIKSFEALSKSLKDVCDVQDSLLSDVFVVRTQTDTLEELGEEMRSYSAALSRNFESCSRAISRLAEINRQIKALKSEKDSLVSPDNFKKELTGASVSILGERIDIISRDGDGNLRDNDGSGVGILANDIRIQATDSTGALQKDGLVLMNAKNVLLSTVNAKDAKFDDKGALQSANYTAEGEVVVQSKTITVEALDKEFKDNKLQEKALTKDSILRVRTEKTDISATDTEGKATGSIALNAKEVSVRSMDVDKEKRTDDKLAAGSTMLLLAEKMYMGARDKDHKSKKLQAVSEEIGLFADKTLETQQGDGKSVLQLSGGNAAVSGSKTQVFGDTTINGKTEMKGDVKAPKATIDNLEAKTSFKSSNISDGIPIPAPPASGNLSTKLKTEDAPSKK